ncbi:MAG TPA: hypothetical protein VF326_03555 [Anaerolineaceae bacterium]
MGLSKVGREVMAQSILEFWEAELLIHIEPPARLNPRVTKGGLLPVEDDADTLPFPKDIPCLIVDMHQPWISMTQPRAEHA